MSNSDWQGGFFCSRLGTMKKVLIVEASENSKTLGAQLRALGYNVITRAAREMVAAIVSRGTSLEMLPEDTPVILTGTFEALRTSPNEDQIAYLAEEPVDGVQMGRVLEAVSAGPKSFGLERYAAKRLELAGLTPREQEVALHRAKGLSIRDTAKRMGLKEKTIKVHSYNAYKKVGAKGLAEFRQTLFPVE